jgi:quercetin dioxygenase-like cupin family protein
MRYLRINADVDGTSRFEDLELKGTMTHIVDGLPPLSVSGPFACSEITFVELQPNETVGWEAHVAPKRQWVIVLSGRVVITVSGGHAREVGPGGVMLLEDTSGSGHLSTPLTQDFQCAMIPLA